MKFLHMSDLHLGRKMNGISLLDDQRYILNQIIDIIKDQNIDYVFICGDIYNNSSPLPDAMVVFDNFLSNLVDLHVKTFVISGNHDSDDRVSYLSNIVRKSGIYISTKFEGVLQTYHFEDEYGKYAISLLPFIKPAEVRRFYSNERIETYEDAVKVVLNNSNIDKNERNIILAHQYITGATLSDVEELSIGGLDNINVEVFDDFDYVALGHIHLAQKVIRDTLRYSGSIIKCSFSEEHHKKSVTIVEMKELNHIEYHLIELNQLHELITYKDNYDNLIKKEKTNDFIKIILTDEEIMPRAIDALYSIFPNLVSVLIENSKTMLNRDINVQVNVECYSMIELFDKFYRLQNNDVGITAKQQKVLEELIEEIREEA